MLPPTVVIEIMKRIIRQKMGYFLRYKKIIKICDISKKLKKIKRKNMGKKEMFPPIVILEIIFL